MSQASMLEETALRATLDHTALLLTKGKSVIISHNRFLKKYKISIVGNKSKNLTRYFNYRDNYTESKFQK